MRPGGTGLSFGSCLAIGLLEALAPLFDSRIRSTTRASDGFSGRAGAHGPDAEQHEEQGNIDGDRERNAGRAAAKRRLVVRGAEAIGGQNSGLVSASRSIPVAHAKLNGE